MERTLLYFTFVLAFFIHTSNGHSYHVGSCPGVDPMINFDMKKFLGIWYVIEKTSTASRCLTNNYTVDTNHSGRFVIEQVSEHFLLGLTSVDHKYHYSGSLSVKDSLTPAKMTVNFPLSVAGSASYTVLTTDYENYAAVFTCQKLAFAHRQSASILSRKSTLEKVYLDKVHSKLRSFGINPYDLSIIDQKNCPTEGYDININPDTFSAGNVAGVVRKAGEKIGDGLEYTANGAKKIYNAFKSDDNDRREELSYDKNDNMDAEWLP